MRNCFISYHHENDEEKLLDFRRVFSGQGLFDYSLKEDMSDFTDETIYQYIRNKMRRSSVTIILIGEQTGDRMWIDWELWASLRRYTHPYDYRRSFLPNGLLGIYLPVENHCIPDRLQDNIDSGYAVTMKWRNIKRDLAVNVEQAFINRETKAKKIDNSRNKLIDNYSRIFGFRY